MSATISKPKAAPRISKEKMYQTILSPLVTEKATALGEKSQVECFLVKHRSQVDHATKLGSICLECAA